MIRMQIQFTPGQATELRRRAQTSGTSISALVRDAVDQELTRSTTADDAWERALAAIGSGHGDGSNVSEYHDDYLADAHTEE